MKWKLGAFREPFEAHKVGEDAGGLRPDMGPQRGESGAQNGRANGVSRGTSAGGSGGRTGGSNGTAYGLGRGRRVVVKARYRAHRAVARGGRQRVLAAHVRYLGRPNATKLGRDAAFFDARGEALDAANVATNWARDRHHWRVILSPEEGDRLDLRRFVRDYAERLEAELDTPLEWVAATHHNTDQPHAHLLIRGVRKGGGDLTLPRELVSSRLREWAEELATRQLGERTEREADDYLNRLAEARRPTGLDDLLLDLAAPDEEVGRWRKVQIPRGWTPDLAGRHHLERRLQTLSGMGLAERASPPFRRATWRVADDLRERLAAMNDASREARGEAEAFVSGRPEADRAQDGLHKDGDLRQRDGAGLDTGDGRELG